MEEAGKLPHGNLTYAIIGAAQKAHAALGPGFPESVYHRALCRALLTEKMPFESEKRFEVHFDGALCGEFRTDLVVAGEVIVELKALDRLTDEHLAQVLSYLKASGLRVGLLLNFGRKSMETRRVVL